MLFLDQQLISYRYSSCCCCSCCLGDRLQKSLMLCRFKSDRGEIWQDRTSNCLIFLAFRAVAAILGGQRGQLTPHFWVRGVCRMILTPHFLLKSLCMTAKK